MSGSQTREIDREALDEFIQQLFGCNWVLGQMISGMLERARSERHDADQEPMTDDAYSLIRSAIGEVADRHGPQQIEAATKLIDDVLEAISDDRHIFPVHSVVTTLFPDRDSPRRRKRPR